MQDDNIQGDLVERNEKYKIGKIVPQTHNIVFKPTETLAKNTKKHPCARDISSVYFQLHAIKSL